MVLGLISNVLAFWPFTGNAITGKAITGNAVLDNTEMPNTPFVCTDMDGGVYSNAASYVIDAGFKKHRDLCSGSDVKAFLDSSGNRVNGKSKITEYYCESNGTLGSVIFTSNELGEGACVVNPKNKLCPNCAYWKTKNKFCKTIPFIGWVDENGKVWKPGCGEEGNKDKLILTYACENNNIIIGTSYDCVANGYLKCDDKKASGKDACIKCTDTDASDNKNVGGIVTVEKYNLDGSTSSMPFQDTCTKDKKKVIQYKCKADGTSVKLKEVACGSSRVCITDVTGAYCADKAGSLLDVNTRLTNLEIAVSNLQTSLTMLQCQINPPSSNTDSCCNIEGANFPGCQVAEETEE